MFDLVFLGTSASAPSIHRGLSSTAVIANEDRFLVDCGEGTQRQILRSGLGFKRLNKILLTHAHLDHILGVGGLISTYAHWERVGEVDIWGGAPTLERIRSLLYDVVLRDKPDMLPIHLHETIAGTIYRGRRFSVQAFPVFHRGRGCFGYIFQEDTHRPFLVQQAEALGVPNGPERSLLVKGQNVTLADGRIITPDMVLDEPQAGVKLVFTGDVSRPEALRPFIQDADALVIEATFLDMDRHYAESYGHLTARQSAELAAECNVKSLLLNHISRRYHERDVLAEARAIFPEAHVVRDLDAFRVRRNQPLEKIVPETLAPEPEEGDQGVII
ncbi:MAG: ribonuclease Z [Anaerolineae bacterium]|nr:ribonuclease Z [Anaerolineae bacterium]MDW8173422.1 ribonuclease Z [Anaerolineae bacterium]